MSASSVAISDTKVCEDLISIEAKLGTPLPYEQYEVCGDRRFKHLSDLEIVLSIEDVEVKGAAVFNEMKVDGCIEIKNLLVEYDLRLPGVEITRDVHLIGLEINKCLVLRKIKVDRDFYLLKSTISEDIFFEAADIYGDITFTNIKIGKDLRFTETKVNRNVSFKDISFGRAINIEHTCINGRVDFNECSFHRPYGQETLSRKAKISCEKFGDRGGADNYFYLEMAGRRKRKKWYIKYPELLIQYCFNYGTKWLPIIFFWFGMVLLSGLFYWIGQGLRMSGQDKSDFVSFLGAMYFSVVTATTLGYGDYLPISWWSKLLAGFEASFGMFLWAFFIAVFARKYMR
ncbi:MAG: potassium channel family protein [Candidatus Omnitrophica bacterium]|nr:potassium channel family protein [Candidatus Omnitrophota bacterium]